MPADYRPEHTPQPRQFEPRLRIAPYVRKAIHLYEMTHFPDIRKVLSCKLLPFCTLTFLLGSIP